MGFVNNIRTSINGLIAKAQAGETGKTVRPSITQPYMSTDTGAKLPIFPFPLIMIYELANNIDALRIPIETINREMFKNGFEIVEKFKYKCTDCSKEFQYPPLNPDIKEDNSTVNTELTIEEERETKNNTLICDTCGGTNLIRPIPEHRKVLENLMVDSVNGNEQTLEDVMRMVERDLEIADNAYILTLKSYAFNDKGDIMAKQTKIKEMIRADPAQIAMIADSDGRIGYDDKGHKVRVCPHSEHREHRILDDEYCNIIEDGKHSMPLKALKAICEVNSIYSLGIPNPKRFVYAEGEVIWKAGKYRPDLVYGFSPIYSIWSKVMALSHMDEYIRKYFDKMRPPRGMLVIASRNYETFRKSWDALEESAAEDPYRIHPLLVENDRGGGASNMAEWIDFTGSLKELEFTTIRRELRMIIGATYGVLPLYFGELPTGWSQEGLQVTITNRAVKWGQDFLYKGFLQKIAFMLNIDDWELRLKTGEETDKLRNLQIEGVEIENMRAYQSMGFEVTRTHTGEFVVSKDPVVSIADQIKAEENNGGTVKNPGKRGGSAAPKEEQQRMQGEPGKQRPSDTGGIGQGAPSSGAGTSMSRKSFPDGITPANFELVKTTLQTSVDFGWNKTKTVEELRKSGMTVRQAREVVKNEFEGLNSWEKDDIQES